MSDQAGASPFRLQAGPAEAGTPTAAQPSRGWWAAVERLLVRAGDWLNPILVKETRQALKSRQFVVTFGLLLIVAWGWSMLGVALMGPEASYGVQRGSFLFVGYYLILALPLLVIVPYGAFRSLATEQEDRTYELMSITTLNPRQIVSGKLGSAVLQMLVYLSAVAPCVAFTYMLRGIAFPTIFFVLFNTFLGSLGLSLVGLLVGTLTSEKHLQAVLSVLVVLGLLFAFFAACSLAVEIANFSDFGVTRSEFWLATAAVLTAYVSYFVLVYFAAAAQLSFASDNRSTRLRITVLGQFLLLVGWMTWFWVAEPDDGTLTAFLVMAGLHWYVMGAWMTGESTELSLRVRRNLPQSFLGRVFLTWFNPGPGTGYVFSLCGMLTGVLLACLAIWSRDLLSNPGRRFAPGRMTDVLTFGTLALCYMAVFLGLGLLLIRLTRKVSRAGLGLSVMFQAVLVLLGCGVPLVIQLSSSQGYGTGYSLLQITNVFWTLYAASETRAGFVYGPVLLTVLPLAALAVFLLNLPGIVREVRFVRLPKPKRVAEEDAEQAALLHPPQPIQISPWDVQMPGK